MCSWAKQIFQRALKEPLSLVEFHVVVSQCESPDKGARNCPLEEQCTFYTADPCPPPQPSLSEEILPNIESLDEGRTKGPGKS